MKADWRGGRFEEIFTRIWQESRRRRVISELLKGSLLNEQRWTEDWSKCAVFVHFSTARTVSIYSVASLNNSSVSTGAKRSCERKTDGQVQGLSSEPQRLPRNSLHNVKKFPEMFVEKWLLN